MMGDIGLKTKKIVGLVFCILQFSLLFSQTMKNDKRKVNLGFGAGISQFNYHNTDDFRSFHTDKKKSHTIFSQLEFISDEVLNRIVFKVGYSSFDDYLNVTSGGNGSSEIYKANIELHNIQITGKAGWDFNKNGFINPYLDLGGSIGYLFQKNYFETVSSFHLGNGIEAETKQSTNFNSILNPFQFGLLGEFGLEFKFSDKYKVFIGFEQKILFGGKEQFNKQFNQSGVIVGVLKNFRAN